MKTKYTSEIFEILRRGQFICSNSPDEHIQTLYKVLEDENTFEYLYNYFREINYILEQGDEYFYFSRPNNNVEIKRKIEKAFDWIDILDFLKTYDTAFTVGYRFTAYEIHNQLKNNADLRIKLENLKKIDSDKKKHLDIIKNIIEKLEKENFISLEDEVNETYKVLTSFNYLIDLINTINIPEETANEIPE